MRVSGKKIIFAMFAIAIALCLWMRTVAPKLTVKPVPSVLPRLTKPNTGKGYITKMFPSMEEARAIAEKKISEMGDQKYIITKYRSVDDGWVFDYESEKYLNSGKESDQNKKNLPIFVHKDGSTEFFSPATQTSSHM